MSYVALALIVFALCLLGWMYSQSIRDNRALRAENERLLARIGWEYGIAAGRPPYSPPPLVSDLHPDDLTPAAPYFKMRNKV